MKTKLFSLFIACLATSVAMAQFHVGFKGGANIVKVDGKSFKDEFRYGYHLGGFAEIGAGKKFRIQPEVTFNQYATTLDSNYKAIYQNIINSDQSKVKLNYLSIPILVNYKLAGPVYLQAGPQFSILMDQDKNFLQNGADAFKKGDFSMIGGVQLNLLSVRVSGRYVIGLSNINDIDNQDKWKSQAVQVSVGFAF
jgi:hypothetical protein